MPIYKQTYIPSVKIITWNNLIKYVRQYYTANIQGKTIVNNHIGLTIYFGSDGKNELSWGRKLYPSKAALVQCLPELLEEAEYTHFGLKKITDEQTVFGYANFKAKAYINGELKHIHIAVKVKASGKAYYCHEVNIKKSQTQRT